MRQHLRARVMPLMHMLPSDLMTLWRQHVMRYLETRLLCDADCTVAVSASLGERLLGMGAVAEGALSSRRAGMAYPLPP